MSEANGDKSGKGAIGIVAFGIYIAAFLFIYSSVIGALDWKACEEEKLIEAIGGCGFFGNCGVKFSDGSYGNAKYPVVGKKTCTDQNALRVDEDSFLGKILPSKKKDKKRSSNALQDCRDGSMFSCAFYGLQTLKYLKNIKVSEPYLERSCSKLIEMQKHRAQGAIIDFDGLLGKACHEWAFYYLSIRNYQKAIEILSPLCESGSERYCLNLASSMNAIGKKGEALELLSQHHRSNDSENKCLTEKNKTSCYNLACFHSLKGDIEMSVYFLQRVFSSDISKDDIEWIEKDPDLVNLRRNALYSDLKKIWNKKID